MQPLVSHNLYDYEFNNALKNDRINVSLSLLLVPPHGQRGKGNSPNQLVAPKPMIPILTI